MSVELQLVEYYTPHRKQILHAVKILQKGGVIVYPTDTIYGLAADIMNKNAVNRIFQIKKVSKQKLLSLICRDIQEVSNWAHVSNHAHRVMKKVLPGAYTFILPASKEVPKSILEKRQTVGIRIPDCAVSMALVEELGRPMLSTSVPMGPDDYITDPLKIAEMYKHELDLVLDGGIMPMEPSTVVDFTQDPPEIIREGSGDVSKLF